MKYNKVTDIINNIVENENKLYILHLFCKSCIIRINTNKKELFDELSFYFREFITYNNVEITYNIEIFIIEKDNFYLNYKYIFKETNNKKIKEEYINLIDGRIIRKIKTNIFFLFNYKKQNLAIGKCIDNINQAINFINYKYIEYMMEKDNYILFHSSAINIKNKGIAISGISGAGKSTLALQLMNNRAGFISNDKLLVKKNNNNLLEMNGIIKYPRVNPGTILNNEKLIQILSNEDKEKYNKLDNEKLRKIENKYDIFINDIYGENRFKLKSVMNLLIILNWNENKRSTEIDKIDIKNRKELLPMIMKEKNIFYIENNDNIAKDSPIINYVEILQNCDIFEVSGKINFEKVIKFCIEYSF